jgi:hypothetical protein
MNTTISNLYKDIKNTLVMPHKLYRHLYVEFEKDILTWTDHSKGYICNKRSLHGMDLESSAWCEENYAYYWDKQGNVHSLIIDWDKGVFNVPSV